MREQLKSKKFRVLIVGIVLAIGGKLGLNLDPILIKYVVGLCMAYLVSQGIADQGKEAAKINALNPKGPEQISIQTVTKEQSNG